MPNNELEGKVDPVPKDVRTIKFEEGKFYAVIVSWNEDPEAIAAAFSSENHTNIKGIFIAVENIDNVKNAPEIAKAYLDAEQRGFERGVSAMREAVLRFSDPISGFDMTGTTDINNAADEVLRAGGKDE